MAFLGMTSYFAVFPIIWKFRKEHKDFIDRLKVVHDDYQKRLRQERDTIVSLNADLQIAKEYSFKWISRANNLLIDINNEREFTENENNLHRFDIWKKINSFIGKKDDGFN